MPSLEQPRARYKQVAELLRTAIHRGDFAPGETLPSQPELAREYGLNQSSISRAIAMLQAEGLIRTQHGRGSVVLDIPTVKRVRRIDKDYRATPGGSSYAEQVSQSGRTPSAPLIQCEAVVPPPEVAEILALDEGEEALIRKRHMFAEGRPIQLATSYIPMSIAGSVDIAFPDTGPSGMYSRIAAKGFGPVRFTEEIEVRSATVAEADFLNIANGQPVFSIMRTAFASNDRPVETCLNVLGTAQWRLTYAWHQGEKS